MRILTLLNMYHDFCARLAGTGSLDVYAEALLPPNSLEIAAFTGRHQLSVPPDIAAFWRECRLKLGGGSLTQDPFFAVGLDFYDLHYLERDLADFRSLAQYAEPGELDYDLHTAGFPLNYSEPQLTFNAADEQLYWRVYDGGTPDYPVASSFTEFFEHYLAAGCFASHDFRAYWPLVRELVPLQIPLSQNKWLRFYERTYRFGLDEMSS